MFTWFKGRILEKSSSRSKNPHEAFFLAKHQALEKLSPEAESLERPYSSRSDFLLLAYRDLCQPTTLSFYSTIWKTKQQTKRKRNTQNKNNSWREIIYKKDIRLPPDERLFKVTSLTVASREVALRGSFGRLPREVASRGCLGMLPQEVASRGLSPPQADLLITIPWIHQDPMERRLAAWMTSMNGAEVRSWKYTHTKNNLHKW